MNGGRKFGARGSRLDLPGITVVVPNADAAYVY
jgi:hypothetical protein